MRERVERIYLCASREEFEALLSSFLHFFHFFLFIIFVKLHTSHSLHLVLYYARLVFTYQSIISFLIKR